MLREQVLREWSNFKEKMTNFQTTTLTKKEMEFLKFLATNALEETPLPMFPLDVKNCRRNLNRWTSANYQGKIDEHRTALLNQSKQLGEINEHLSFLELVYLDKISMFNSLVEGWKQEHDNHSDSGPTIEEVD